MSLLPDRPNRGGAAPEETIKNDLPGFGEQPNDAARQFQRKFGFVVIV